MILVTGGAGFIGSYLVGELAARGLGPVAVCDRFGTGDKWKNLAKHPVAAVIQPENLMDWLAENGGSVNCIFHMGAISATTEADTDLILETNFNLSLALWYWCAENDSRLIYASSAATYGNGDQGFDDDNDPAALAALRPLNPYGWSKKLFDVNAVRLAAQGAAPLQWVGLKFFNVYGPNEYHKGGMRSVAHQVFEMIRDTGRATLFRSHHPDYEDGGQMRDFVWVGDVVDMMLWLYDNPHVSGIFNSGSGKARSFLDLANATFAAMDREVAIDWRDTPEEIRRHYQYFTEASMTRIAAAGYKAPGTSLEEGVAAYVQNFLATDDRYR
ncbi:ADP-glyceromanno-heptose 6-epimerase [Rhodospirillaceae bacterium KN72]|uniref:ADP-L-glycero-D-manno-heptose-6-epimerase n=1 Tax=Pacificispira spongiicola TaxID=2729598 RepID=A0A7Y0DX67_9PROT|nr:ADP-glyceromanno-heptose 6-epimerase [Pacificispira spongiicola]NMM43257.1 ADP-glyceromanno-heptose 6-epimerase [Pacificispira spongiicola]